MTFEEVLEKLKSVYTFMPIGDMKVLYDYARKVPRGGTILEVGTASGSSAFILALASKPSCSVFTIDPVANPNFFRDREELGLKEKVQFFHSVSKEVIEKWDKEIDLLFIDGMHNYEGVTTDIEGFVKWLKKGGVVIIHDYSMYRNTIGAAVDDAITKEQITKIDLIENECEKGVVGIFIGKRGSNI